MKKMIFYINTIGYGGAERVITNLADRFCKNGYAVTLVTSYSVEKEYTYSDKINRVVLSPVRFKSQLERNIVLTKKLRKLVKEIKPDILVSFMGENNFRAIASCMGTKTSCVVSVRNDPDREYPNKAFKLAAKILYKYAKGVVFQTEDAKAWFDEKIQKKSQIILNQVDIRFYEQEPKDCKKDIVTTGRLVAQKNHEMLIDAFASVANDIKDNLYIYGQGPYKEKLEAKIKNMGLEERIFLPGATDKVPEVVKSAKLFVLSSDFEGMPNALMEAMVLGTAVVSTDCPCGGPKYLIDNMENGVLVPIKDKNKMAEAINLLMKNDDLRAKLGQNAKKSSMNFHPDVIYSEWEKFLKGACGK